MASPINMAKNVYSMSSCIKCFIEAEYVSSKPYTRQKCEWSLLRTKKALENAGFDTRPRSIEKDAVLYLMNVTWSELQTSSKKIELSYLKRFLRFYGNDVIDKMKIILPHDMRINVDWLDEAQYNALMKAEKTPREDMVIHLELCMGLRQVEVCRLMVDDVHTEGSRPYMDVRGKGRGDGKYRTVRFHYDTVNVLNRWMKERDRIVDSVLSYNPTWTDPGNLLIWCHNRHRPEAGPYTEHGGSIDEGIIYPMRRKVGFKFSNHTLRRTFGRRLFHAGVPMATIARFLGHESVSDTMKYIGVNMEDMDRGMDLLRKYDMGLSAIEGKKD